MEKVCLHHTYILNLLKATKLTLSEMYTDLPAWKPPLERRGEREPGGGWLILLWCQRWKPKEVGTSRRQRVLHAHLNCYNRSTENTGKYIADDEAVWSNIKKNWSDFLRVNENETQLFTILSRERAKKFMQQMEVKSSALLLNHAWPTLPHVHKKRPTLDYFCTWQMLCKRGVGW